MKLQTLRPLVPALDTRTAPPAPKVAKAFYLSSEWRSLITRIIAKRGRRCEDPSCDGPHTLGQVIYGDHMVELEDGGAPLDENNVLLRCARSHGRKTAAERAKRMARPVEAGG